MRWRVSSHTSVTSKLIVIVADDMLDLFVGTSRFKYLKLIAMHWGNISRPEAEARLEKVGYIL